MTHDPWKIMINYFKTKYHPHYFDVSEIEKKHEFSAKLRYMFLSGIDNSDVMRLYFEAEDENSLYLITTNLENRAKVFGNYAVLIGAIPNLLNGYRELSETTEDKIIIGRLKGETLKMLSEMPEYRLRILLIS